LLTESLGDEQPGDVRWKVTLLGARSRVFLRESPKAESVASHSLTARSWLRVLLGCVRMWVSAEKLRPVHEVDPMTAQANAAATAASHDPTGSGTGRCRW
jgi:hypothetical protein